MAAASSGAMFPILRWPAWLKKATRVLGGAGIWTSSWHGRHTALAGIRLSDALVLAAAATWQVTHSRSRERWSLCEKGAAYGIPQAVPHTRRMTASLLTRGSSDARRGCSRLQRSAGCHRGVAECRRRSEEH